jgi:hypothetical protein
MVDLTTLPRMIAVSPVGMAARLGDLRREFEQDGDWPETMEVNAALFLSDVCRVLGLSDAERRKVLGVDAAAYVATEEDARPICYVEEE